MKFIPILFSTVMVYSIEENRKTQTRRIIKPQPSIKAKVGNWIKNKLIQMVGGQEIVFDYMIKNAPYKSGDILWVKETWIKYSDYENDLTGEVYPYMYKASDKGYDLMLNNSWLEWRPSMLMPKVACRIFLKVKSVHVERLNDISENDAKKEGVKNISMGGFGRSGEEWENYIGYGSVKTAKESFFTLWQSISKKKNTIDNPWVWVIEFERIELTENQKQIFHNKN